MLKFFLKIILFEKIQKEQNRQRTVYTIYHLEVLFYKDG